jgi:hypothetical protein
LHAIWDTVIVEHEMVGADPAEYAASLEEIYGRNLEEWKRAGIQADEWAWESHNLAQTSVYG